MKTIVTHLSVDLDAIASCWLIKKYLPGWANAEIAFVPAGSTLDKKSPDENPEIIHVDTGFGKFDHHQSSEYTCAAKLVLQYLLDKKNIPSKDAATLERIIEFVNETDHFAEVYYNDPQADRYDFALHQLTFGLRPVLKTDHAIVEFSFNLLEASYQLIKSKIAAEAEVKKGYTFQTKWGKSIVIETSNHEAIKLALKNGYSFAATKDPKKGSIRIKTLPEKKYNLTPLYEEILKSDKKGTWFLHVSKNMLLNASSKNPNFIPSSLTVQKLIAIIKGI